ncbi:hypothetical protein [Streptomyces sp. NPDC056323]|uniref:hypothetical protein n=1 Tax=Streptomyces sp. NPDC056323 TaxID=3345784 RepID=UPI0035DFDDE2
MTYVRGLGFDPQHDKFAQAVHSELSMYKQHPGMAMKIWGWDEDALTDVEHYKIDQLKRMFAFQEKQIFAALERLGQEWSEYQESDTEAERQAVEFVSELPRRTCEALNEYFEKTQDRDYDPDRVFVGHVTDTSAKLRQMLPQLRLQAARDGRELPELPEPPAGKTECFDPRAAAGELRGIVEGVMSWRHPAIARNTGPNGSLAMGGVTFEGDYWRLMDNGYPREYLKDDRLYDLIDTVLAVQAEYQLQCLLMDREFTRVVMTRGAEFEWLKAEAARKAAEEAAGPWGLIGSILGIVSAVAGVLALIPVFTPIAGPIAAVASLAALGVNTVDAAIKGDWDAETIMGLGADVFSSLPGIGAIAKGMKAGKAATKAIGAGAKATHKASVGMKAAGRSFLAATGGAEAANASKMFEYIGTKGAKALKASEKAGKLTAKVIQGSVDLATQIPTVTELAGGGKTDAASQAAGGGSLASAYSGSIGHWGAVGAAAKKTSTVSLSVFAAVIGR